MWLVIKYTMFGKIGAFFIGLAPVLFAVEIGNHVDALIAAIPPTAAVVIGVIALKRGQKTLQVNIDGRMEQLLKATEEAAIAKGKEKERVEARDRREEIRTEISVTNEPTPQSNKGVITIIIITLAINATIGLCVLGYCLVFKVQPDQVLLTAFVAMVNYLLGVISGVLSKTSPTETTKQPEPVKPLQPGEVQPVQDVKVVNKPKDSVPTTESKPTEP